MIIIITTRAADLIASTKSTQGEKCKSITLNLMWYWKEPSRIDNVSPGRIWGSSVADILPRVGVGISIEAAPVRIVLINDIIK